MLQMMDAANSLILDWRRDRGLDNDGERVTAAEDSARNFPSFHLSLNTWADEVL